jgi:wyosine [tRNA(Phe)-imidazoG37] synthetase (radical SAM superfamily)
MNEIYLNCAGDIFTEQNNRLHQINCKELPAGINSTIHKLQNDSYASFFKTPFHRVAYGINSKLCGEFSMTPGDFNPGSPFDAFYAVREYIRNRELYFPRLYLYPTSVCNSHCALCQFHSRHRENTSLSISAALDVLKTLRHHAGKIKAQTLIISGDGEPMMFPYLQELLEKAMESRLRIFLTTNLRKPCKKNQTLYETIAKTCAMITISIKGLSNEAYIRHQGTKEPEEFEQVMENLTALAELRGKYGREEDCLLGVASLFLPENTPHYQTMITRLHNLDIDYFYINQVEPSVEHWGILFTEEEQHETLRQLSEYAMSPHKNMIVRCAGNPFKQAYGNTVYYDAAKLRIHPELCGSALFNPLVLSVEGNAVWHSCRNSELFGNHSFMYQTEDRQITANSVTGVMSAASSCHNCRLERQVKHFDKIIDLEIKHIADKLDYYLVFDTERLPEKGNCFIKFENAVK